MPSFRRWAAPRPLDLTEYAYIRRNKVGEGKARPMALNGAVNRPHLRRKCLPRKRTRIWLARNGPLAGQGKLVAVFGDGLWLTDPDRDVGRTKQIEWCLDWGERAKGPLSPGAVYWETLPARESAGSIKLIAAECLEIEKYKRRLLSAVELNLPITRCKRPPPHHSWAI